MVSFSLNRPGVERDAAAHNATGAGKPARSPRRRVLISGQFQALTSTQHVAIRNLSCTGASIVSETPLRVGAEGVLVGQGLDQLGRIVWCRGNAYGFKFDDALPNCVVLELHRITANDVARAQSVETREWFHRSAR